LNLIWRGSVTLELVASSGVYAHHRSSLRALAFSGAPWGAGRVPWPAGFDAEGNGAAGYGELPVRIEGWNIPAEPIGIREGRGPAIRFRVAGIDSES